jgi:60 kDa SS-A/Ro ribonucleoprotein
MEHAVENVPSYQGKVYVMIDVSGSMGSSITGNRGTATSKMSCRDVAALMASVVLRKNPNAEVIVFDTAARRLPLNGFDSIMTNAAKISCPGGGTDCGAPVQMLNRENAKGDLLIMVSDNMSWMHGSYGSGGSGGLHTEFAKFKQRNPKAKLVCIDILADSTSQAKSSSDVLNVGGFSDQVFDVINGFIEAGTATHWVDVIKQVAL